ncbi:MAG: hypothetical protein ABL916_19100 [Burkholderiaceae bacterium]
MTSYTPAQIERFKRQAKVLHRASAIPHSQALDRVATANGYSNWSLLMKHSDATGTTNSNGVRPPVPLARTTEEMHLTVKGVAVLPPEAKTYFDKLWSDQSANAAMSFSRQQSAFEKAETAKGRGPGGAGFAARLSALYKEDLKRRASTIAETLTKVHQSFNSPLGDGVDAQLQDWGARALSDAYQGLEGGYLRHMQRFGLHEIHASGLDHTYSLAQVTVANSPSRYLWELRHVPTMRPQQPTPPAPAPVNIHNHGSIGAVQTGAGSTANVQQLWVQGDTAALQSALDTLRMALERAQGLDADMQRDLVADIDRARAELGEEKPSKGRLLRWLGGVGAVVQVAGSIQPAYAAVKGLANGLGIPLP